MYTSWRGRELKSSMSGMAGRRPPQYTSWDIRATSNLWHGIRNGRQAKAAWQKRSHAALQPRAEVLRCKALSLPWQIQSFTCREIGYPGCSQVLASWIDKLAPVERRTSAAKSFSVGKKHGLATSIWTES
jgi:hypothetical protein